MAEMSVGSQSESVERQYPYPIATLYRRLLRSQRQSETWQHIFNLMLDLHEVTVRFLALIVLSNYLRNEAFSPSFNERLRQLLHKNLSLGDWVTLLRETVRVYHQRPDDMFFPEIASFYFKSDGGLTDVAQTLERFVELRNDTRGHMLTLSEQQYQDTFVSNWAAFVNVLERLDFLASYQLIVSTAVENDVIVSAYDCTGASSEFYESTLNLSASDDRTRDYQALLIDRRNVERQIVLYPLYVVEDDPVNDVLEIMFFDGAKLAREVLISLRYLAIRKRSKVVFSEDNSEHRLILRDLNVSLASILEMTSQVLEANQPANRSYYFSSQIDLIDAYLETFVGRKDVLNAFSSFCANSPRGIFLITGGPGQGKSAVAAQVIKDTGAIHHFIASDEGRNIEKYIVQSLLFQAQQRYELPGRIPDNEDELRRAFSACLQDISVICQREHKSEFIVLDGLDELLATAQSPRIDFLPSPLPPGIFVLLTSRPLDLMGALASRITRRYELEPLSYADVEAVIRAQMPDAPVWTVTSLYQQSGGNPLYVRCVLNELSSGRLDADHLPTTIEDLYRDLLHRLQLDGEELALDVLGTITVAYEGLTVNDLASILGHKKRDLLVKGIKNVRTFLLSNQGRYSIFHKSMKDFLVDQTEEYAFDAEEIKHYHQKIIDACQDEDQVLRRYKLQYLPFHLYDVANWDELVRLSTNARFTTSLSELLVTRVRQIPQDEVDGSPVGALLHRLASNDSDQSQMVLLGFFAQIVHYGYLAYCRAFARTTAEIAKARHSESQYLFLFAEARIAQAQGDLSGATALLEQVEPHLAILGSQVVPQFLFLKAETLRESGHYVDARLAYEACRDALGTSGDQALLLDTLLHLGDLEYVRGELAAAAQTLHDALTLAEELRLPLYIGQGHRLIGHILYVKEEYELAIDHYRQAQDLFVKLDDRAYLGRIFTNLAETYAPIALATASSFAEAAISVNVEGDFGLELGKALYTRADIARMQGHFDEAAQDIATSLEQLRAVGYTSGIARAFRVQALLFSDQGQYDAALAALEESDRIFGSANVYPTFVLKNMISRWQIYGNQQNSGKEEETKQLLAQMAQTSEVGFLANNILRPTESEELDQREGGQQ